MQQAWLRSQPIACAYMQVASPELMDLEYRCRTKWDLFLAACML